MKNKIIAFLIVLSVICAVFAFVACQGQDGAVPGGSTGDNNNDNSSGNVGVEENIDYSKALNIEDDGTVVGLTAYGKTLSKIIIPQGVTSIDEKAFNQCYNLTSVEISTSVTDIGSSAFASCGNLKSISIPDTVKSIGSGAFRECGNLTSIELPNNLTSIGSSTFLDCSSLISVKMPSKITSIGNYVFKGCGSLASIEISENVTKVGEGAFAGCNSATIYCKSISQPSEWAYNWNPGNRPVVWNYGGEHGVTDSGIKWALTNSMNVAIAGYDGKSTTLEIPAIINGYKVVSIVNSAFSGCSIKNVVIPVGVVSIDNYAFYECKRLTELVIPGSVKSIGENAFCYCTSLISVKIPVSVTTIGENAFGYCGKSTIYCEASSQPSGWYNSLFGSWNPQKRPVEWNYNMNN